MGENVKVAVRVRPFTDRERQLNSMSIIRMPNERQTEIFNPQDSNESKKFNFDYSYWSHDGYRTRADGYLESSSPEFADQRRVFNDLGQLMLDNAWRGYNCCLFAYGQTGSGKSFSVVGYGANKGIVPLACEQLFSTIDEKKERAKSGEEFQVSVSMLQIYNEQVNDLLDYHPKEPLKVRQHPIKGFYVEKLSAYPVRNYDEIQAKLDEGLKSRSVASTDMNATSSRAHTVFAITFSQRIVASGGVASLRSSTINLVDLAGSERLSKTHASGDRLKEGVNINLSLSTLGNCIKALVDQASGKNVVVPYRDSVLTMLLKNALEGNSKTIMIAALSPADVNYEETLSTLRFADRMKAIKTTPTVNESGTDKLVRELKEENARLQTLLQAKSSSGIPRQALEELIRKNQSEMDNMRKTWEERLALAQKQAEMAQAVDRTKQELEERKLRFPHLWNLNEDPALTALIVHFIDKKSVIVGNSKREPAADIVMNGLGILFDHAVLQLNAGMEVSITPGKHSRMLINGNTIRQSTVLRHNDRVMFGMTNLYVYANPAEYEQLMLNNQTVRSFTFEEAQNEIHSKQSGLDSLSANALQSEDPRESLLLRERLIQVMTNIHEANYMSNELRKGILYEPFIIPSVIRGGPRSKALPEVCCKVTNMKTRTEFIWDSEKLADRKFVMQEVYANYAGGMLNWNPPLEKDPFFDMSDTEQLVGVAHICLQPLAYLVEIEGAQTIIDASVHRLGMLDVQIHPCDSNGNVLGADEFLEDPNQLLDAQLHLRVRVGMAKGLPERFNSTRVIVRLCDIAQPYSSYEILKAVNVDYNYEFFWKADRVSENLLDFLLNDFAIIEIHGKQRDYRGAPASSATSHANAEAGKDLALLDDQPIRYAAELSIMQRRAENAENKLQLLKQMLDTAKDGGASTVGIDDIHNLVFRKKGRGVLRATHAAMRLQKRPSDD